MFRRSGRKEPPVQKADPRTARPGGVAAPSRPVPRRVAVPAEPGVPPVPGVPVVPGPEPDATLDATYPLGRRSRPASDLLAMRCLRCQGPVEWGTAPVRIERGGYRLAWEEVPAWVCRRCDLAYFEPREVETIQRALKSMRRMPKG